MPLFVNILVKKEKNLETSWFMTKQNIDSLICKEEEKTIIKIILTYFRVIKKENLFQIVQVVYLFRKLSKHNYVLLRKER